MASVGHIAVGMAAARLYHDGRDPGWRSMVSWSALSMLPDADVVGFALGVQYGDPFGHRGAIGLDFISPNGLFVSLTELVLFAPLLVWALRTKPIAPPRIAAGLALWLAAVWLIGSTDPVREAVMGRLLREDTAYSSGFSEAAFRTVAQGQPEADVRRRLGLPRAHFRQRTVCMLLGKVSIVAGRWQ